MSWAKAAWTWLLDWFGLEEDDSGDQANFWP
jgi:hypothetical protein